ncbi:MAG: protein kinase domain-containing protein, partial [Planctomycetia bacterium]
MDAPQVSDPTDEGSPDATLISARSSEHFAPAPSMAELGRSMEGRSLGPYRLLEFVGGGGMGAVFRALDSTLDRIVAVKVLSHRQSSDEEMLKRFRNEAQSAARLDHENIGRVYAVGSDGGWHYIVFE